MPHVYVSKVLSCPASAAWEIVRDFGGLPRWFPFVVKSELQNGGPQTIGAIRVNSIKNDTVVKERLTEMSELDRRIVYDIVETELPTKNYRAVLRIAEVTTDPSVCFAEWSADFDVEGDPQPTADWVRDEVFKTCLEELERVAGPSA